MSDAVVILLATYNGERYLGPQLESLLAQTHKNIRILVRDDGSTDKTLEILANYAALYPNIIQIMQGPNLGFVGNFWVLIQAAPADAQAYFFCDQDDIWLPEKVEETRQRLESQSGPALAFGRLALVDEQLMPMGLSPLVRRWSLGNALFENQVTGCSMAVNTRGLELLRTVPARPECMVAHDWWIYLVMNALGTIVYDAEPRILYRQHGRNVLGAARSRWASLWNRLRNFSGGRWHQRRPEPMVAHFLDVYRSRLKDEQIQFVEAVSLKPRFWTPLWLFICGRIWRRGSFNQGVLLFMLLVPGLRRRS